MTAEVLLGVLPEFDSPSVLKPDLSINSASYLPIIQVMVTNLSLMFLATRDWLIRLLIDELRLRTLPIGGHDNDISILFFKK